MSKKQQYLRLKMKSELKRICYFQYSRAARWLVISRLLISFIKVLPLMSTQQI